MKKHDLSRVLLRAVLGVFVVVVLATWASTTAQAVQGVLFNDTFDVDSAFQGSDINEVLGAPRQSGAFIDQYGTVSYYQELWSGANTLSSLGWTPNMMLNWDGAMAAPQRSFGNVFSQGGLTVEFDLNAMLNTWSWMSVGPLGSDYYTAAYGCPPLPGSSVIAGYFPDSGGSLFQIFENNVPSPVQAGNLPVDISDQGFHHYKVVYTDPTDDNPFDGQGETDVAYYIQDGVGADQQIGVTEVFGGGGLFSAVVNLQALGEFSQWDNLTVTGNVDAFANPWASTGSGNWNNVGNWTTGVPDGAGSIAGFWNGITGYSQITVDLAPTVGTLIFGSPNGYLLMPDENNYSITLDNSPSLSPATIDVEAGINEIMVPLVLSNSNLNISINSVNEELILDAGLSAGGKDVTVTSPFEGTWYDNPEPRPGGTLTVLMTPVTGIGTLTLNFAAMHIIGTSVEAQAVAGGTGALFIEGGSLVQPTKSGTNPSIDVLSLDLSGSSTYTALAGTTVRTSALSSSDFTGVFTLDGGTLAINNFNGTGAIGGDLDIIQLPLLAFYLGENGGTIDCGDIWSAQYMNIENAPGVTDSGPLTVTGRGALSISVNSTYNGGTIIKGGACAYTAVTEPLGFGDVDLSEGAQMGFGASFDGVMTNNFVTHGPARADAWYTAFMADWNAVNVDLSGQITLNDGPGTPGDPATFTSVANQPYGGILNFSGPLTGPGGLVVGSIVEAGTYQNAQVRLTGTVSNDYEGPTVVVGQILALGKDDSGGVGINTAVAVPHDLILDPRYKGFQASAAALLADNQTSTDTVVYFNSPPYPDYVEWAVFDLNGFATTVRGIVTIPGTDGLNGVENLSISHNLGDPNWLPEPATTGTLTIMTQDGDDFVYTGYIADAYHIWEGMGTVAPLALIKDGKGTQELTPGGIWGSNGAYIYTGGTTVKDGTLDVSAVGAFTPGSLITLEGGTLIAGNELSGPITRGATTSGTLEAGGTTFTSLTLTGQVDIGAAVVDADHTLVLAPAIESTMDVIDAVTGAGDLQVGGTGTTLTSGSVSVRTLTVGAGNKLVIAPPSGGLAGAPAPVPEPSTLVLLALAGLAYAWYRLRK
jgi:hypothetical protein